jgi:hypothetical protein
MSSKVHSTGCSKSPPKNKTWIIRQRFKRFAWTFHHFTGCSLKFYFISIVKKFKKHKSKNHVNRLNCPNAIQFFSRGFLGYPVQKIFKKGISGWNLVHKELEWSLECPESFSQNGWFFPEVLNFQKMLISHKMSRNLNVLKIEYFRKWPSLFAETFRTF